MHTIHSMPNRMSVYAEELASINERLKRINTVILGGRNVSDRPPVPPPSQQGAPAPGSDVVEDNSFCDAFEYQDKQISYKLDYTRDMLDNLELFTSNNKQAGGQEPANFPAGNKTRPY